MIFLNLAFLYNFLFINPNKTIKYQVSITISKLIRYLYIFNNTHILINFKSNMDPLTSDPKSNKSFEGSDDSNSVKSDDLPDENIDENLKAQILQHPLFQHEKDETLSWLIRVVKPLLEANPNTEGLIPKIERFGPLLFRGIFENKKIPDLQKQFEQFNVFSKTVCGDQILADSFYFRCLDCERADNPEMVSALCANCFDKANHEGHRVLFIDTEEDDDEGGYCDCGDPDMLNPGGFCSDHQSVEVNLNEILQKFPQAQVKKCQTVLSKAIYGALSLFEIMCKIPNRETFEVLLNTACGFLDQTLSCLENGYKNISQSFLFIVASILQAPFPEPFNKFWHNCDNFTSHISNYGSKSDELIECKCTILGHLLRNHTFFYDETQMQLQSILMASMRVSKFRDFAAIEYTKFSKTMFPQAFGTKTKDFPETSKLAPIHRNFISPESSTLKIAESGYFKHYVEVLRSIVDNWDKMTPAIEKTLETISGIICSNLNPKYRTSTGLIVEKTSFMKDMLEIITIFQRKFLYRAEISLGLKEKQVKLKLLSNLTNSEKYVCNGFENGLRYISECKKEDKIRLIKEIAIEWLKQYNSLNKNEVKQGEHNVNLGLERVLCHIIRAYEQNITKEMLEEFFKTFFPEINQNAFCQEIFERVLTEFGLMRCLVRNFEKAEMELSNGWTYPVQVLFETDVVLIQMMTMFIHPEDVFKGLADSYFSFNTDLKDFCKGEESLGKSEDKM